MCVYCVLCVCIKIYIKIYVCSARAFMLLFSLYTTNKYFPKEREFFLFLLNEKTAIFPCKEKKMATTTWRTTLLQRGAPSAAKRFYTRGGSGGATTSFANNHPDAAEAVPLLVFVSTGLFCFVSHLNIF